MKRVLKIILVLFTITLVLFVSFLYHTVKKRYTTCLNFAIAKNHPVLCKALITLGADINKKGDKGKTPIEYAIEKGNIEICRLLIKNGADINSTDKDGNTLLHKAITLREKQPIFLRTRYIPTKKPFLISQILLEAGADVNAKNKNGETPLHLAAGEWDFECCKLLIKYGAKINPLTNDGLTPLDYAKLGSPEKRMLYSFFRLSPIEKAKRLKKAQDIQVIKLLEKHGAKDSPFGLLIYGLDNNNTKTIKKAIKRGADVNKSTKYILLPIYIAAKKGDLELYKLLIENGTKLTLIRKFNAIAYAIQYNHINILKYFIENLKVDINIKDKKGNTLLHKAAFYHRPEISEYLISKGINPNAKNNEGNTPLHELCIPYCGLYDTEQTKNIIQTCKILLKHGAEINARNKEHLTPLFLACQNDPVDFVKYLVQNGAIYNEAVKKYGFPPYLATYSGRINTISYFIKELKFYPARQDLEGWNLFHWACANFHLYNIEPLIKGFNPFQPDKNSLTPADLFIIHILKNEVKLFQPSQEKDSIWDTIYRKYKTWKTERDFRRYFCKLTKLPENKFHYSLAGKLIIGAITDNTSLIEEALKQNANININEKFIGTPLTLAAERGNYKACKLLIEKGADVNIKDDNGIPPLIYAANRDYFKVCKLLVEHGADVNAKKWGITPLFIAAMTGNLKLCKLLLKHGAKIDIKDKDGKTPLDIAKEKGYLNIATLLKQYGAKE